MSTGSSVVGVVGDDVDDLVAAIGAEGGQTRTGEQDDVLSEDLDAVVTVGESPTLSVGKQCPNVPLIPVGTGRGLRSVPADRAVEAAASIVAGDWDTESHPLVRVDHGGGTTAHALMDVTLVTAEAARISEFSVRSGDTHVGQFRADGVVVATPAGTPGYARRVGTPIAAAGTGILTVAPIAPFATNPDHWLVSDDSLRLTVDREEAAVTLFADDRSVDQIAFDEPVTLTMDRSIPVAVLPESQPRFP